MAEPKPYETPMTAGVLKQILANLPDDAVVECQPVTAHPGSGYLVVSATAFATKGIIYFK